MWQTEFFLTLDHFLPFYSPNNSKNHSFDKMEKKKLGILLYHNWKSYDVCFLRYEAWQTFLPFWAIFCPFTPLTTQKNQHFEKMKQKPGDTIILNKSTKNYYHMLYCSWEMAHGGCNFHFLFWDAFCPFKTPGDITILLMWFLRY